MLISTVLFSAACVTVAIAQGTLPEKVASSIEYAARRGIQPNHALTTAVVTAIGENPNFVEQIVAYAVTLAPRERDQLVGATIRYFPGHTDRIVAGANLSRAAAPPAPPAATMVASPQVTPRTKVPSLRAPQRRDQPSNRRYYASIGTGIVIVQDSDLNDPALAGVPVEVGINTGFLLNGALGYRFENGLRAEFEIAYRRNDLDSITASVFGLTVTAEINDATIDALAFMANGYYDLPMEGSLIPFLGGGLGFARISVFGDDVVNDSDTVFAYQFAAGAHYSLSSRIALRGEYKLFGTANPEFGTTEAEYLSHNFEVGLTYDF